MSRLLCNEPRGHADMYGGMIVPADDAVAIAIGSHDVEPAKQTIGSSERL
jgi:hypothetical protein